MTHPVTQDDVWARRRRNLRVLLAVNETHGTKLASDAGLSPNTVTRFLNGSSKTLSSDTLARILPIIGLRSVDELDAENPFSDPMREIRSVVEGLPSAQQYALLDELRARFGSGGK